MHSGGDIASDTWADQLRFPPWIEDRSGVLYNQAFYDATARLANRDDAAPALSFHAEPSSSERPHDHGA